MLALLKHSGPKRAVLAVLAITSCLGVTAVTSAHMLSPTTSYDYLQDHLDKSQALFTHTWLEPTTDLQAELSPRDMIDISDILDAVAIGEKQLAYRTVLQGQALDVLSDPCSLEDLKCSRNLRISRKLKPINVHGDFRIANILEESQRINLNVSVKDQSVRVENQVHEKRNLRFIKTRDGWMLKTIDILQREKVSSSEFPELKTAKLAGVNYYPASASWKSFWVDFPKQEIENDLATISTLGGNAVRIFLSHSLFNDAEAHDLYLDRLTTFLDMCDEKEIKVLVTLFDLRSDYRINTWEADTMHIRSVLEKISNHTALFGVDLKNEPDLDAPAYGFDMIESWISTMAGFVHSEFPNIPVTVGWSNALDANRVSIDLDFISYHDFRDVSKFEQRLEKVKTDNPGKLVMVSEIGSTIWSPPFTKKQNEKKQARRLETQLKALENSDGYFVWTLNDFAQVKSDVAGRRPWRKAQQAHFGLKRLDGSLRPAAKIFRESNSKFLNADRPQIRATSSTD